MKKNLILNILVLFCGITYGQTYTQTVRIEPSNYGPKLILNDYNTSNKVPIEFRSNNVIKWELGLRPIGEENDLVIWRYTDSYLPVIWFKQSNGNVGIGTNAPSERLVLYNNSAIQVANQYGNINTGNGSGNGFIVGIESVGNGIVWNRENSFIRFGTNATERLRILSNGNVGIGTTNPTEKLVVDGKIIAEEVKVQNVPASDYVFEPDYNLLSLQEVETFIKENKHLPNIPSAEEFKENGVGLGEMDNMLLRKVEELVLYMIEMQKQVDELKAENEILKQK